MYLLFSCDLAVYTVLCKTVFPFLLQAELLRIKKVILPCSGMFPDFLGNFSVCVREERL